MNIYYIGTKEFCIHFFHYIFTKALWSKQYHHHLQRRQWKLKNASSPGSLELASSWVGIWTQGSDLQIDPLNYYAAELCILHCFNFIIIILQIKETYLHFIIYVYICVSIFHYICVHNIYTYTHTHRCTHICFKDILSILLSSASSSIF